MPPPRPASHTLAHGHGVGVVEVGRGVICHGAGDQEAAAAVADPLATEQADPGPAVAARDLVSRIAAGEATTGLELTRKAEMSGAAMGATTITEAPVVVACLPRLVALLGPVVWF